MKSSNNSDSQGRSFDSQFRPDGTLDFRSRVGITSAEDPLRHNDVAPENDDRVTFDEHRHMNAALKGKSNVIRSNEDGDIDGLEDASVVW